MNKTPASVCVCDSLSPVMTSVCHCAWQGDVLHFCCHNTVISIYIYFHAMCVFRSKIRRKRTSSLPV